MCATDLEPDLDITEHEQVPGVAWGQAGKQAGKHAGVAWGRLAEITGDKEPASEDPR